MGTSKNTKLEGRDAKRTAAEDRKTGKASERLAAARGSMAGSVADWGTINPDAVMRLISVVTASDAMVSFSYSRDGGAYCVSIYDDGDKERFWIPRTDDVEAELNRLAEFWL